MLPLQGEATAKAVKKMKSITMPDIRKTGLEMLKTGSRVERSILSVGGGDLLRSLL